MRKISFFSKLNKQNFLLKHSAFFKTNKTFVPENKLRMRFFSNNEEEKACEMILKIEEAVKEAMRNQDKEKRTILRNILSKAHYTEKEKGQKKIDNQGVIKLLFELQAEQEGTLQSSLLTFETSFKTFGFAKKLLLSIPKSKSGISWKKKSVNWKS